MVVQFNLHFTFFLIELTVKLVERSFFIKSTYITQKTNRKVYNSIKNVRYFIR